MPRENFSRRVARAAAVGGGRTYRAQTPVSWYAALIMIVLLGVSVVVYSRYERLHPLPAATKTATPPTAANEWQAAFAIDACGKLAEIVPLESPLQNPMYNIGNGVIDIAPSESTSDPALYEGKNANLNAFFALEKITLTGTLLSVPGKPIPAATTTTTTTTTTTAPKGKSKATTTTTTGPTTTTTTAATTTSTTVATKVGPPFVYRVGQKCGSKPAILEAETWPNPNSTQGTIVTSDIAGIEFTNGELITLAFVPKGTTILRPNVQARNQVNTWLIEDPSGLTTTTTTLPPVTLPPTSVTTSSTPSGSSSTTSSTPTTTKAGVTTTTKTGGATSSTS